jgi:hypothetical protein
MEELIAAIVCEEEANDLPVYLVSEGAANILRKRKDEGYYSSLMGSELKFREFCRVSRDTFQFIFYHIPHYNLWYTHDEALIQKIQTTTITFPACSHTTAACRAEVEVWLPQPHDAMGPARCPCATLVRVMFKNQSPSKLQLCLLRVTSRSRKGHCMVKNQG